MRTFSLHVLKSRKVPRKGCFFAAGSVGKVTFMSLEIHEASRNFLFFEKDITFSKRYFMFI